MAIKKSQTPVAERDAKDITPPATPTTDSSAGADTPKTVSKSDSKSEPKASDSKDSDLKEVHTSPVPSTGPRPSSTDEPTRESLLQRARLFVESPEVRNAPDHEKLNFLLSKGLTDTEARSLLRQLVRTPSSASSPAPTPAAELARQQQAPAPPPPPPVVVTYPEYLAAPPKPPGPIISGPTLMKAAYFSAATAASFYVANNLLVQPMLNALTAARSEFYGHVGSKLDTLTEKLSELAPEAAAKLPLRPYNSPAPAEEEDEEDSDDEEITEVFQVDAATQTVDSAEDGEDATPGPDGGLVQLTDQMKVLVETHSDATDGELMFLLEDLTGYLEGLTYDSGLAYSSPFGIAAGVKEKDKEDPIAKVKQEIRSVKGVLLHTKNFPAGRMGR